MFVSLISLHEFGRVGDEERAQNENMLMPIANILFNDYAWYAGVGIVHNSHTGSYGISAAGRDRNVQNTCSYGLELKHILRRADN